jgi:metal-responsive CopG/Arc/MetJ family transcriptional regulator
MKKKVYTRPVSVALSEEMFVQVKTIADNEEIGISDYIREAVREKLATFNQNNIQKGE